MGFPALPAGNAVSLAHALVLYFKPAPGKRFHLLTLYWISRLKMSNLLFISTRAHLPQHIQ